MKKNLFLILGVVFIILSLTVLAYPSMVLCINERYSSSTINNYNNEVSSLTEKEKVEYLTAAKKYNKELKDSGQVANYSVEAAISGYNDILKFEGGVVGYINIPAIDLNLPIYHGNDEIALSKGAAHLPNTAFPVGGNSSHCVLAAHTAYADQIFFDNIYKLKCGDKIHIIILNDKYTFSVTESNVVIPTDTSILQIKPNRELLSLVTCWPYAQNTHRMVVTAEREDSKAAANPEQNNEQLSDSDLSKEELNDSNLVVSIITGQKDKLNNHEIIVLVYLAAMLVCFTLLLIIALRTIIKKRNKGGCLLKDEL